MSFTTTAPLILPRNDSMSSYADDRSQGSGPGPATVSGPGPGAYYSRPASSQSHGPSSSHGLPLSDSHASPERHTSSGHSHTHSRSQHDYREATDTPYVPSFDNPSYTTPILGSSRAGPVNGSYDDFSHSNDGIPSPPQSDGERAPPPLFTPEGNPIVPVGVSGGKMFQCSGFGCDRVFTRSEHLARHVRKHTGEKPFPCHCGKSFSRLDNLRQHAATVHSDTHSLNEAMLNSLSPVHSALSAKASKEQRRRGEIVEVPKNAVERPRHTEPYRNSKEGSGTPTIVTAAAYPPYTDNTNQWDQNSRPRTGASTQDYPYSAPFQPAPHSTSMDAPGPSRRPGSSADFGYSADYYEHRPQTSEMTYSKSASSLPYTHRPSISTGRNITHGHYAESEPPTSAHGPPLESPIYTSHPQPLVQSQYTSPPPPQYPQEQRQFYSAQTPDTYGYDIQTPASYGPPPPGSSGSSFYPTPVTHYGPSQQHYAPPPSGPVHSYGQHRHHGSFSGGNNPYHPSPGSPFQFSASVSHSSLPTAGSAPHPPTPALTSLPPAAEVSYSFPPAPAQSSSNGHGQGLGKRRHDVSDDQATTTRKTPRVVSAMMSQPLRALQEPNPPGNDSDELWMPPLTERRASLAVAALLCEPAEEVRPSQTTNFWETGAGQGVGGGGEMEEKAKALLGGAH